MTCLPSERAFALKTAHGTDLSGCRLDFGGDRIGIFVHGFRSDRGGTKSEALARHAQERRYDWLRVDLSGHGQSSGDFRDFRLSTLLADLEAVLDRVAMPVVLVGSSMGGWLSALAAQRRPNQVRALILIAPAFNFIQLNFGSLPAAELVAWRQSRWRTFASRYGDDSYELEHEVLADAAGFDLLSQPQTLSCPVAIIHGERDEAVPLEVSERFLSNLSAPKKAFSVIPHGDHRLNAAIPLLLSTVDRLWVS